MSKKVRSASCMTQRALHLFSLKHPKRDFRLKEENHWSLFKLLALHCLTLIYYFLFLGLPFLVYRMRVRWHAPGGKGTDKGDSQDSFQMFLVAWNPQDFPSWQRREPEPSVGRCPNAQWGTKVSSLIAIDSQGEKRWFLVGGSLIECSGNFRAFSSSSCI